MTVVGLSLGAVLATSLALLVAAFSTASPVHLPGFPDIGLNPGRPAGATAAPVSTGPSRPGSAARTPAVPPAATIGTAAPTLTASPTGPSKPGRVPTQTPSHPNKNK